MKNIKAVIFDLDNTLIDRQRAFKEMLNKKIVETLPENKKHLLNEAIQDILLWDNNGIVCRSVTFANYCEKYEVVSMTSTQLNEYWTSISGNDVYLFDDVLEIIKYLKSKYRLAILSNGNALSQRRKLNSTNILHDFEFSTVSGEVGIDKPDKRIFDYVVNKLELKACECVYIGDNYAFDIEGSQNAGLNAIFVNRSQKKDVQGLVVEHLIELKEIL